MERADETPQLVELGVASSDTLGGPIGTVNEAFGLDYRGPAIADD